MTNTQPAAEACAPMIVLSGPADCLDCDEHVTEDGEPTGVTRCSHVSEVVACETHSTFADDEWGYCTHFEPLPHEPATVPSTVES